MFARFLLQRLVPVLVSLSVASFVYLYLYPVFHGCAFPLSSQQSPYLHALRQHVPGIKANPDSHEGIAPFRLLVLADPQIEGDTSLPKADDALFQRLAWHWANVTAANNTSIDTFFAAKTGLRDIFLVDIPRSLRAARKRLDLFGNDYYLAHIYRTLRWWARPTHVTVLGDLVGSQWVSDEEFQRRAGRYWGRVFHGGVRVEDEITVTGSALDESDADTEVREKRFEILDALDTSWSNRIISIAGNHDIGYAGDINEARIERFESAFGRANWDVRFQYNATQQTTEHITTNQESAAPASLPSSTPSIHLIVLNSLTLDTPALSQSIQAQTYKYINDVISHRSASVEDHNSFTLLLTHVPLHKREGICTDAPYFAFHEKDDDQDEPRFKSGGLREQNHLSDHASQKGILQGIFGMSGDNDAAAGGIGRNGLILTGHDHTGCDVAHYVDRPVAKGGEGEGAEPVWSWDARRYDRSMEPSTPNIREVTLRSMMGEFGGNAGLLSLWFDQPSQEWKYEIVTCQLGVQHIWWAVHALCIVTLAMLFIWGLLVVFDEFGRNSGHGIPSKPAVTASEKKQVARGADGKPSPEKSGESPGDKRQQKRRGKK